MFSNISLVTYNNKDKNTTTIVEVNTNNGLSASLTYYLQDRKSPSFLHASPLFINFKYLRLHTSIYAFFSPFSMAVFFYCFPSGDSLLNILSGLNYLTASNNYKIFLYTRNIQEQASPTSYISSYAAFTALKECLIFSSRLNVLYESKCLLYYAVAYYSTSNWTTYMS